MMTMLQRGASLLAFSAVAALAISASGASAQADESRVLSEMRDCARIADMTARVACYDRNIAAAPATGPAGARAPAPAVNAIAAAPQAAAPVGLGAETVRRDAPRAPQEAAVSARVTAAAERVPGLYLLTLADGAQWRFANSVGSGYVAPGPGAMVEIRRGALGSYLLHYNDQADVRVIRVR